MHGPFFVWTWMPLNLSRDDLWMTWWQYIAIKPLNKKWVVRGLEKEEDGNEEEEEDKEKEEEEQTEEEEQKEEVNVICYQNVVT